MKIDPKYRYYCICEKKSLMLTKLEYFPETEANHKTCKFIRNPFKFEVEDMLEEYQEEFLELKFDSLTEDDLNDQDIYTFCPIIYRSILESLTQFFEY